MIPREGPHSWGVLPVSADPREWSRDLKNQNKNSVFRRGPSQTENFNKKLQNGDSYILLPSYCFDMS